MGTPLSRSRTNESSQDIIKSLPINAAAIDFGTTSLSLSYSTKGDDEWATSLDFGNDKRIPNAILLKKGDDAKFEVLQIGKEARQAFMNASSDERERLIYFERVKMLLRRDIKREAHVTSYTGEHFYLIEVIAFILKHLAETLEKSLDRGSVKLKKNDFDWVITVPAIWDVQSKRMMREAAFLSGILTDGEGITTLTQIGCGVSSPEEINPEKLLLALEPECAAIYSQIACKKEAEKYKKAAISKDEVEEVVAKLGKGYMIIDAGGGTVDITTQVEVRGGGVEVVTVPIGNALGGTQINEKFSSIFQDIVDDKGFEKFIASGDGKDKAGRSTNDEADIIKKRILCEKFLYDEFESQKLALVKYTDVMCIDIPHKMINFYGEQTIINGISRMELYEYEDDKIRIPLKAAEDTIFHDSLKSLIKDMFEALNSPQMKQIHTIYLVGGFGSSKIVEKHVKKELVRKSLKIEVIVPPHPTIAIAHGAVMLRKNPAFIRARRADANYGIAIREPFDATKHNPAYKIKHASDDQFYCENIFDIFLKKGELVDSKKKITTSLHPSDGSEEVILEIYSSEKNDVKYVKTLDGRPIAKLVGRLIIEAPNPKKLPWRDREIDVTIDFSGAEIQATAMYRLTKKEVKTVCDFL
ncbi:PREDICTED: heat shock 70 kDa protein 12A-like [Amphimedon queenslandica]|uniref:Uncharacterized protein n=1 Tax=Amphimedon queenslandica TaxID=400682 RepID=A0A1X7UUJ0_AMPQE|nr:PREDICTED: heat shock 70 kDa protein 12A-like [Amphimedon queenslandica]|eukprot:XP_011404041.1 PREDICTED: heat shock 70 kDa protein 12A-like [Amphimedon queenslandica]